MLGHPLITKAMDEDDGLGTILSVIKDNNNYILEGRLLFPTRIKNNLITGTTIERIKWQEPIEVFDTLGDDKQLVGAGKLERKEKNPIVTRNREITVNKRQISYEGLAASLETGEDGIQNMITNNKDIIMDPKDKITQEEIDTIPGLKENQLIINQL